MKVLFYWLCLLGLLPQAIAQTPFVVVQKIDIEGNRKTRVPTILRELDIQVGDTIPFQELMPRLRQNEKFILNMGIFLEADIQVKSWDAEQVGLHIQVLEDWYIYPFPIFELADRNFNVWWTRYKRSFQRTNLGIWLQWRNFTGRNDVLEAKAQGGFTQKYELRYKTPFFDKKQRFGFRAGILYAQNREIAYNTQGNKLQFVRRFNTRGALYRRFRAQGELLYRKGLFVSHAWRLSYHGASIADTVRQLNPDYFLHNARHQRALQFRYQFRWDRRNFRPYPRKGFLLTATLLKDGLGIFKEVDQLSAHVFYGRYFPLTPRMHLSLYGQARAWLNPARQSYYNNVALGYNEDYVRGFQYYVVNGQHFALIQSDLHYKLFDFSTYSSLIPIPQLRRVPVLVYARPHADIGYVADRFYTEANPLTNRFLAGYGVGVDFIFYLNIILQLDYTLNNQGEHGFYLRYFLSF